MPIILDVIVDANNHSSSDIWLLSESEKIILAGNSKNPTYMCSDYLDLKCSNLHSVNKPAGHLILLMFFP